MSVPADFLQLLRPGGPWVLSAIVPDGAMVTITADTANKIDAFVSKHNGKRNLYHCLNPTQGLMNKKPKKGDIAAAEFVHTRS